MKIYLNESYRGGSLESGFMSLISIACCDSSPLQLGLSPGLTAQLGLLKLICYQDTLSQNPSRSKSSKDLMFAIMMDLKRKVYNKQKKFELVASKRRQTSHF